MKLERKAKPEPDEIQTMRVPTSLLRNRYTSETFALFITNKVNKISQYARVTVNNKKGHRTKKSKVNADIKKHHAAEISCIYLNLSLNVNRTFASPAGDRGSITGREGHMSLLIFWVVSRSYDRQQV